jgi:hypothetical protein
MHPNNCKAKISIMNATKNELRFRLRVISRMRITMVSTAKHTSSAEARFGFPRHQMRVKVGVPNTNAIQMSAEKRYMGSVRARLAMADVAWRL